VHCTRGEPSKGFGRGWDSEQLPLFTRSRCPLSFGFGRLNGLTLCDSHGPRIAGITIGTRNRPFRRGFHSSHLGDRDAPSSMSRLRDLSIKGVRNGAFQFRIAFGRPRAGETMRARKPCSSEGTLKRNEAQEGAGLQRWKRRSRYQTRRWSKAAKPTL